MLAAIIVAYFWKNDCTPGFDIDEYSLLNIPYRIVTFGDSQYPAVLSDGFNSQEYRKYPPPMALELAMPFIGFSVFHLN